MVAEIAAAPRRGTRRGKRVIEKPRLGGRCFLKSIDTRRIRWSKNHMQASQLLRSGASWWIFEVFVIKGPRETLSMSLIDISIYQKAGSAKFSTAI